MVKRIMLILAVSLGFMTSPIYAQAKTYFHAAKKAAAKKIMAKGFSLKKLNPHARYGKGIYLAESKKLALKEKPSAEVVVKIKDSKMLRKNSLNIAHLNKNELKLFSRDKDLRGNIKKGLIGGDLAKKTGKSAGRYGLVVQYPSAKGKGMNTFIPGKVYEKHPKIVKPVGVIPVKK